MLADLKHRATRPNPPDVLWDAVAERGLLAHWPDDVIALVNGVPVTKADVRAAKRERNARNLARKRHPVEPVWRPAFVTVFDNGPIFPYGGKWTGIQTRARYWTVERQGDRDHLRLMIMRAFPLGFLPTLDFYALWQEAFMRQYHHPIAHRPTRHGRVVAWALVRGYKISELHATRPSISQEILFQARPIRATGGQQDHAAAAESISQEILFQARPIRAAGGQQDLAAADQSISQEILQEENDARHQSC